MDCRRMRCQCQTSHYGRLNLIHAKSDPVGREREREREGREREREREGEGEQEREREGEREGRREGGRETLSLAYCINSCLWVSIAVYQIWRDFDLI